jgi:solute carrier family 25 (mitochondrial carnitine/acylcarnitine transporter), member 20/29
MAADVQGKNMLNETEPIKIKVKKTNNVSGGSGAHDYKGFVAGVFSGIAKLSGVFLIMPAGDANTD